MNAKSCATYTIICFVLFCNIASLQDVKQANSTIEHEVRAALNNTGKAKNANEDNGSKVTPSPTNDKPDLPSPPNSTISPNVTEPSTNKTVIVPTTASTPNLTIQNTTTLQTVDPVPVLPAKDAAEDEHNSSMAIFFVLCVLALGILLIHLMLQTHFQYVPESVVIVFLGALIGLIMNALSNRNISNWRKEEAFSPTAFFLILLPPIIFESGYNLHKAVDPVATIAIFHALNVDPILNMLVFGESILNDAIAIVLTNAALESNNPDNSTGEAIVMGIQRFCLMFFASAGIGVIFALVSALLLKHVDLRKNPSLEFGMMLVFTYAPYVLAEGIHLSGIMAILFCGIVMSHYAHFNLSTVTQITMQQTLRTLAFIAETCVFAYLGLALFSFKHRVEPALVVWSIILCLLGRACNIFPLAILVNRFREHQITKKMMFIMWFSGLRGAISYALSLHLNFSDETRHVIITTTLIIVLVTTLFFGGSTMPLLKFMQATKNPSRRLKRRKKEVTLSKTREWGQAIDSEHLSETTEGEMEVSFVSDRIKGFAKYDLKYLIPFFTRRFTQQELKDCKSQMTDLTNQWYQAIRISPDQSDEESAPTARSSISSIVR
ncbi:hypothetical protein JTB14_011280 [Gonioctena quinquepunctata]|nr:hypothetical protein JTB14_011280 [Gonioctena quinquepunctata]